jgi:hypothetical protein
MSLVRSGRQASHCGLIGYLRISAAVTVLQFGQQFSNRIQRSRRPNALHVDVASRASNTFATRM